MGLNQMNTNLLAKRKSEMRRLKQSMKLPFIKGTDESKLGTIAITD